MMGRALLIVGWLATVGFGAAGVLGYRVGRGVEALQTHLLVGLLSCLMLLFSHCWIMFYLIGTGKAVREAVVEHRLEGELVARTRGFKARSYPLLLAAMGLAIATFVLGGGVFTGAVPAWLHHGLFYAALGVQVWALAREGGILAANEALMADVDRRVG